jgi:hypothetical protein
MANINPNQPIYTAPGQLRLKCMIWENNPISDSVLQDYSVIYNSNTLDRLFPDKNQRNKINYLSSEPGGIFLPPKYVYRDTFLSGLYSQTQAQVNTTTTTAVSVLLNASLSRINFVAENGLPLFGNDGNPILGTDGNPLYPYMAHQTFIQVGSLFSKQYLTSNWSYKYGEFPFEHDGHTSVDQSNQQDVIPGPGFNILVKDYVYNNANFYINVALKAIYGGAAITNSLIELPPEIAKLKTYSDSNAYNQKILERMTHKFYPDEITSSFDAYKKASKDAPTIASGGQSASTTTNSTAGIQRLPIHWLVEKQIPLYQGEDFFVEFIRSTPSLDVVPTGSPLLSEYSFIDSSPSGDKTNVNKIPANSGILDLDDTNSVVEESRNAYSLGNKAYYIIEIGHNSENDNYFIIIADNAKPICVHAGKFKYYYVNQEKPSSNSSSIPKFLVAESKTVMSRRLSVYDGASGKELLGKSRLRVAVRSHLGRLVVTFNGYEDTPWIIEKTDIAQADLPVSTPNTNPCITSTDPTVMNNVKTEIIIPPNPIRIGAGNVKCGFTFGPIHYSHQFQMPIDKAIQINGKHIKNSQISLMLTDPGKYETSDNTVASTKTVICNQDAEVLHEIINGEKKTTRKSEKPKIFRYSKKGPATSEPVIKIEFDSGPYPLRIGEQCGSVGDANQAYLLSAANIITTPTSSTVGSYVQEFTVKYFMQAGNVYYKTDKEDNVNNQQQSNGNQAKAMSKYNNIPNWFIHNAITPIGTGWRLRVLPLAGGYTKTPTDVAVHVENLSITSDFSSSNYKIERSGNIKFRTNLGQATYFLNSNQLPKDLEQIANKTTSDSNQTPGAPSSSSSASDYSDFLSKLVDKTFFIRIYAWWEGGFASCDTGCPCKQPGNINANTIFNTDPNLTNNKYIVFTGLAHGGDVTVDGNFRYIDCKLYDYMKILSDQYFLNSPFFDGMRDYNAVSKIISMAGFTSVKQGNDQFAPAAIISSQASNSSSLPTSTNPYTGEKIYNQDYVLPSAYNLLEGAYYKMADTSPYTQAIDDFAQISSKMYYFDRFGVFNYVPRPDALFANGTAFDFIQPKCNFVASPAAMTACSNYDIVALDQYTYTRNIGDMYNSLNIRTATPEGAIILGSQVSLQGRYNPDYPGYVGYDKALFQANGIFGSQEALNNYVSYLSNKVFTASVSISWTSIGVPHLQASDIVTFTGLNDDLAFPPNNFKTKNSIPKPAVTLILNKVTSSINPQKGEWLNNYEGEWLYGKLDEFDFSSNRGSGPQ